MVESLSLAKSVTVVVIVLVMPLFNCMWWLFVSRFVFVRDAVCGCRYESVGVVLPNRLGAARRRSNCIEGMQAQMIPTFDSMVDM